MSVFAVESPNKGHYGVNDYVPLTTFVRKFHVVKFFVFVYCNTQWLNILCWERK